MEKIVLKVDDLTIKFPNGFSVTFPDFQVVKSGWVVALSSAQNLKGVEGMRDAIVAALETSRCLMGWVDGEDVYWEVVMLLPTEDLATFTAKKAKQKMIYQIETGLVKWLF